MKPLPDRRYELATWSEAKVNIDYHVAVKKHFYSVPYTYTQKCVDVRLTEQAGGVGGLDAAAVENAHPVGQFPIEKVGRQRRLYFNPVPIQLIYERWTDEYSALWASHVTALKSRIEQRSDD